ncbi:MAG: hypothetical protein ACI4TC_07600 [Kiritimatiellia bacterium]
MRSSIAIRRRRSGFWLRSIRAITKRAKSAPKATFVPPKNLTHADESAIRTWVQGLERQE